MPIRTVATNRAALLCGVLLLIGSASLMAQVSTQQCGPLREGKSYGPYDYRYDKNKLGIVEEFHFQPIVEALIRGRQGGPPGGSLNYTLHAFPNHHRALLALVRYGERTKSLQPEGLKYPIECFFERALRFQEDDNIVRMIYAGFLGKQGRTPDAIKQLDFVLAGSETNALTHYNVGLVYFDIKEYEKALAQAHKALSLGLKQTALQDQLAHIGKWSEPAEPLVDPTAKQSQGASD